MSQYLILHNYNIYERLWNHVFETYDLVVIIETNLSFNSHYLRIINKYILCFKAPLIVSLITRNCKDFQCPKNIIYFLIQIYR